MNETEKLLCKISKRERDELLHIINSLDNPIARAQYSPIKLTNSNLYRIRKGKFRIIFYIENDCGVVVAVRYRNEKTYKLGI